MFAQIDLRIELDLLIEQILLRAGALRLRILCGDLSPVED